MSKYYYLVASLPYLQLEEDLAFTEKAFLEECGKWVREKEYEEIVSAELSDIKIRPCDEAFLRKWKIFDKKLRGEFTEFRKARKEEKAIKPAERIRHIVEMENPLVMEKAIARIRWEFLEQEEAGKFFEKDTLVVYYLKLQILHRLAVFEKDEGEKTFYHLCEVKYENGKRQDSSN